MFLSRTESITGSMYSSTSYICIYGIIIIKLRVETLNNGNLRLIVLSLVKRLSLSWR